MKEILKLLQTQQEGEGIWKKTWQRRRPLTPNR